MKTPDVLPRTSAPKGSAIGSRKLRDELLNGEIFYTLKEAKVVIGHWRKHYNTRRPHSALGYRPPAPEVAIPKEIIMGLLV